MTDKAKSMIEAERNRLLKKVRKEEGKFSVPRAKLIDE